MSSESEDVSQSQESNKETLVKTEKEWRVSSKSTFVHGNKVISNDGIESLEPCIGGSYKASAVSI